MANEDTASKASRKHMVKVEVPSAERHADLYVHLYETGFIPGGKASTEAHKARVERDLKSRYGK